MKPEMDVKITNAVADKIIKQGHKLNLISSAQIGDWVEDFDKEINDLKRLIKMYEVNRKHFI